MAIVSLLMSRFLFSDMRSMLDSIFERLNDLRNLKLDQKKFLTDKISHTETQLMVVTREMKLKIHNMVEEVEQKVSKALNEEIWRLNVLVDEFNLPFHTDALVMNVFKKEINAYVENGLGSNLRARLSTALAMNIETAQREMTDRMTALVPKEKLKEQTAQIITARSQPFEMLYSLNCQNLCSDFQEDLEFRFSWGVTALIQRFNARRAAGKGGKAVKYRHNGHLNVRHGKSSECFYSPFTSFQMSQQAMTPTTDLNSPMTLLPQFNGDFTTDEQISLISRIAAASIGSQGTVGGLIIAGIVRRFKPGKSVVNSLNVYTFSSFSKPSDGECCWVSVESTCQSTHMNACRGPTRRRSESSRSNTSATRLAS